MLFPVFVQAQSLKVRLIPHSIYYTDTLTNLKYLVKSKKAPAGAVFTLYKPIQSFGCFAAYYKAKTVFIAIKYIELTKEYQKYFEKYFFSPIEIAALDTLAKYKNADSVPPHKFIIHK